MLKSIMIGFSLVVILLVIQYSAIECGKSEPPMVPPGAITLVISSNTTSHFTPCGCSTPMGGVLRRGTAFANLRSEVQWPLFFIDTGNVSQGSTNEAQLVKDDYIFQTYGVMKYDMVNVGLQDARLGDENLMNFGTLYGIPWASCNTFPAGATTDTPEEDSETAPDTSFAPYIIKDIDGYKVAIMGVMLHGLSDMASINSFSFTDYQQAIQDNVAYLHMVEKVNLVVVVTDVNEFPEGFDTEAGFSGVDILIGTQGQLTPSPNVNLNPDNPQYRPAAGTNQNAVAPNEEGQGSEVENAVEYAPLDFPIIVPLAETQGKRLNRIDIWLDSEGRPFDYNFRNIGMDPSYEDDVRMAEIADGYDRDVLIGELERTIGMAYAGSDACEECHPGFLAAWEGNGHFTSYQTIADEGALDDRSCTKCHAVGLTREPRLLPYASIPEFAQNVGCEGCHDKGNNHINFVNYMNTLTPAQIETNQRRDAMSNPVLANLCVKCHTGEWAEGFNAAASIIAAREICQSVR